MTYFQENPFATNIVQPETVTNVVGPIDFGPFDCSQFQGARFKFINEGLFSAMSVTITWYDDLTLAQAPTAFNNAGFRQVVINSADSAVFTLPHLADWMVISLDSLDAGTFQCHWAVAHRQNGIEQWAPGSPILFGEANTGAIGNGVTSTLTTPQAGVYAGPFHMMIFTSNNAGFGYDFRLEVLRLDNTWRSILRGTNTTPGFTVLGYLPPLPRRLVLVNNSGGVATLTASMVADDWRAA